MTPLMCDAVGKNREQGSTARRSSTEHAVKVGKGQRAAGEAKAAGAVRVGGRRVAGVKGTESEIDTNLVGQAKTELIVTPTRPARLVRRAAEFNLITNPMG